MIPTKIHSPVRYGVITCGNGIPPRPNMPKSEYYKLLEGLNNKANDAVQFSYPEYINRVVDSVSKHRNPKGMFGLLSMLKNVADEYPYCSFETFSTLELYFLHAYSKYI
jgi:hypothetical protein